MDIVSTLYQVTNSPITDLWRSCCKNVSLVRHLGLLNANHLPWLCTCLEHTQEVLLTAMSEEMFATLSSVQSMSIVDGFAAVGQSVDWLLYSMGYHRPDCRLLHIHTADMSKHF